MNYRVFRDTQNKPLLTEFEKDAELRPTIGDTLSIHPWPTLFKITNQIPQPDAPLNATIDYFVRELNSSPDSTTMGRDIRKLTTTMRHLGR